MNVAAPPKYMPAIAAITVRPEIEHGTAGGRGRRLQRRLLRAPACALLALTAQVEHRVVHADGQADQQHDRADRLVHRPDLADRADQADRRGHGGDGEQQRHEGREQRAESEDQDDQRDRQRGDLRLLEVVLERLARAPCRRSRRRTPRSGSRSAACRAWTTASSGGVDLVLGVVVVAGDVEGDERGLAVLRQRALVALGVGALDVADVLRALERRSRLTATTAGTPGLLVARPRSGSGRGRSRWPCRGSASDTALSARPDSPMPYSSSVSVLVPTEPPMKTARITNASQPKIAFFRCCALHRPARAARLSVLLVLDRWAMTVSLRPARGRSNAASTPARVRVPAPPG